MSDVVSIDAWRGYMRVHFDAKDELLENSFAIAMKYGYATLIGMSSVVRFASEPFNMDDHFIPAVQSAEQLRLHLHRNNVVLDDH